MKKYVPDYYKNFRCIADKCRHSCCIGWEIDIDTDTLAKYEAVGGEFGKRLRDGIKNENGTNCFILGEGERCPFLNQSGLCDIFSELGEEYLSQICTDHPRFRNFFSDREELGLGLCCEAVCRIVLSKKDKTVLEMIEDDGEDFELYEDEKILLAFREKLFGIAQDRNFDIKKRCEKILELFEIEFSDAVISKCADLFAHMEIMDPKWQDITAQVDIFDGIKDFDPEFEVAFEQLLVYFLYRHLAEAEDLEDLAARSFFAVLSVYLINNIFEILRKENSTEHFELLCDICRMYSSEIEYCEENTEKLKKLMFD